MTVHQYALSKSQVLPLCGAPSSNISFISAEIDCLACRLIAGLGPLPPKPEFITLEEFTTCEWFALCENGTSVANLHPILGYVPLCERCAKVIGETLPCK